MDDRQAVVRQALLRTDVWAVLSTPGLAYEEMPSTVRSGMVTGGAGRLFEGSCEQQSARSAQSSKRDGGSVRSRLGPRKRLDRRSAY